jgi:hypothetical protein
MKIYTNTNSSFPSQVVSDEEKASYDYGLQVSQAIEQEWFDQGGTGGNRYLSNWNNFHNLRLYARGEQSVQKYKDELSINGDSNGMANKSYDINAFAQDPFSVKSRTDYAAAVERDMMAKDLIKDFKEKTGVNAALTGDIDSLPESREELDVHLQMTYKQNVEVAEEEAINNVLNFNKYSETKKRLAYDLTTIGIACSKTRFNDAEGIITSYVR